MIVMSLSSLNSSATKFRCISKAVFNVTTTVLISCSLSLSFAFVLKDKQVNRCRDNILHVILEIFTGHEYQLCIGMHSL